MLCEIIRFTCTDWQLDVYFCCVAGPSWWGWWGLCDLCAAWWRPYTGKFSAIHDHEKVSVYLFLANRFIKLSVSWSRVWPVFLFVFTTFNLPCGMFEVQRLSLTLNLCHLWLESSWRELFSWKKYFWLLIIIISKGDLCSQYFCSQSVQVWDELIVETF